jgi:hypothetical protein
MISDDDEADKLLPKPARLEDLSMEALHAYLDALRAEIARVNEFMAERGRARNGAEELFKIRRDQ